MMKAIKKNQKIADLLYGHPGKYIQTLKSPFNPTKYPLAPKIQICQLECGCWIVADGNNRIGLVLNQNPNATIADLPSHILSIYEHGDWDEDTMKWWNPAPKTFAKVMALTREKNKNKIGLKTIKGKIFYGLIEKITDNTFCAVIINVAKDQSCSAVAPSISETKKRLKNNIRRKLRKMNIEYDGPIHLKLDEINIEAHECSNKVSL